MSSLVVIAVLTLYFLAEVRDDGSYGWWDSLSCSMNRDNSMYKLSKNRDKRGWDGSWDSDETMRCPKEIPPVFKGNNK